MIRIKPLDQIKEKNIVAGNRYSAHIEDRGPGTLHEMLNSDYNVYRSGKEAIAALLEHLNVTKKDEIYITTTTETNFVSTCVSATIFNYCKPSRVFTERTKAIFVIHNFGFPHPKLSYYKMLAQEKGIVLIEDAAFAFDSFNTEGARLGSIGDYSIYSLSKIMPINYGGILEMRRKPFQAKRSDSYVENEIKKWVPRLWFIKEKRRKNYSFFQKMFETRSIYGNLTNENPFMFGLFSKKWAHIYDTVQGCEMGKTHVAGEVHIPVNAFIETGDYKEITEALK